MISFFFPFLSIMPIIVLCFQKFQKKGRDKSWERRTNFCLLDQANIPENPLPLYFSMAQFNLNSPLQHPDTSHQSYSVGSFLFLKDFLGKLEKKHISRKHSLMFFYPRDHYRSLDPETTWEVLRDWGDHDFGIWRTLPLSNLCATLRLPRKLHLHVANRENRIFC